MGKTSIHYEFVTGTETVKAELTKEVAGFILRCDMDEANYLSRTCHRRWHYSLDQGDGIECAAKHKAPLPYEYVETEERQRIDERRQVVETKLKDALAQLSVTQQQRIMRRYYEQLTFAEIARQEGVTPPAVLRSVNAGIKRLRKLVPEDVLVQWLARYQNP